VDVADEGSDGEVREGERRGDAREKERGEGIR
jgi:hypothetical protein